MKFRERRRTESNIDLTPLIDVVFILLIFFMVSTTFTRESRLGIVLPEAESGEQAEVPLEVMEITINDQGAYAINGQALVNDQAKTLQAAIEQFAGDDTQRPVIVQGDARAPHEAVVRALDVLGKLGFSEISIGTRTPDGQDE
ncbi:MAG: biopolymer transporter ExbD [Gammaproteobacteria bacterium]|nr:MAG: biopolymer transporter ExbD [Gammaproteobacteria bacterium]